MKNRAILFILALLISGGLAFGQTAKDTVQNDTIQTKVKIYFSPEKSWQISKEAYEKQLKAQGLTDREIQKKMQAFEQQKTHILVTLNDQLKTAEKQMKLSDEQRKIAEKQLEKFRKQYQSGEFQKQMAEVRVKMIAVRKKLAAKQQKITMELRTNVHSLLNKDITLTGKDSKSQSVKVMVNQANTLFFNVAGNVSAGNVLIEIFNPKGQKEGELSLEHRHGSNAKPEPFSGSTSGSLNKIINAPQTGEWVVKIKPKKSKGHLHLSATQFTKPEN